MRLSRERKIYVGVLGIGLAVLGADQVMGPPSTASASGSVASAEEAGTGVAAKSEPAPTVTMVALAERLGEIRARQLESEATLDAFKIAPEWRHLLAPQSVSIGAESADVADMQLPSGVSLPRVTVVVQDQAGGMAVLDGEVLRVGQVSRSGITLVGVERRSVRVQIDGKELTIDLADSAGSSASMSGRPAK